MPPMVGMVPGMAMLMPVLTLPLGPVALAVGLAAATGTCLVAEKLVGEGR